VAEDEYPRISSLTARCASARQPRRCDNLPLNWLDATAALQERHAGERGRLAHQLILEAGSQLLLAVMVTGGGGPAVGRMVRLNC
jgi:hypothetical protein